MAPQEPEKPDQTAAEQEAHRKQLILQSAQQAQDLLSTKLGIDLPEVSQPETLDKLMSYEKGMITLGILAEISVACLALLDAEAELLETILVLGGIAFIVLGGFTLVLTAIYRDEVMAKKNKKQ